MASTTIPDVKEALLTMMQGIPTLTSANVDISYAEKAERRRDAVWMGETTITEMEPAGFRSGRSRRHEDFTVNVYAEARGTNPLKAEQSAFSYAAAIEEALADDPKVDSTLNLSWAYVEEMRADTADTADGAYCRVEMIVRCKGNFL